MKQVIKSPQTPKNKRVIEEKLPDPDLQYANFEWFAKVDNDFKLKIESKVLSMQSLTKRGEQQRCFDHNIPFSLYCTHCRKVICASCMYNFTSHKRHKVIPLENASKEIKEDLENMICKLDNKLKVCEKLVDDANFKLMMSNRTFEKASVELSRFYDDLAQMLKKKREQQIKQIHERQEEANKQLKAYHRAISKFNIFVNQKFRTYGNPNVKFELLVPSRGIIDILNNSLTHTQWLDMDFDRLKFELDIPKLKDTIADLQARLKNIQKPTFAIDINKMEKKITQKKVKSHLSFSAPKHFSSKMSKTTKVNNFSVVASPRSVRKWQYT